MPLTTIFLRTFSIIHCSLFLFVYWFCFSLLRLFYIFLLTDFVSILLLVLLLFLYCCYCFLFLLLCKSSYSVQMREKCGPEKLRMWTFFTQWLFQHWYVCNWWYFAPSENAITLLHLFGNFFVNRYRLIIWYHLKTLCSEAKIKNYR